MLHRRDFLKLAATLSTAFGVGNLPENVSAAIKKMGQRPIFAYRSAIDDDSAIKKPRARGS